MIYSVDFTDMSGKISHVNVVKYLRDLGWKEIITKRKNVKVFQLVNDEFYQVDVPTSHDFSDYNFAMYKVVETIAHTVNKTIEQVILELLNPLADILKFRIAGKETEYGSILVEDALNLYDNAKKLILATAMDILAPKPFHIGRPDSQALELVSRCRFGQTEIGSYVVSVVCPFIDMRNGKVQQLSLFNLEDECANSLTRKVTRKLISSLRTIKEAIDSGCLVDTVNKDDNNISANFLEAVSAINIYNYDSQLDVSIKWAPTIRKNTLEYNTVLFTHDYYEPIISAANTLKNTISESRSYVGRIKGLIAMPDADERRTGIISLVYLADNNRPAIASVKLSKEDYDRAIIAHQGGKYVKVDGVLTGKQSKRSIEYTSFDIMG